MLRKSLTALIPALLITACSDGGATFSETDRKEIWSVGSSTVFPFANAVAERFAESGNAAPRVESTGTGGGMQKFCSGLGPDTPDIVDASRRMTRSEFLTCRQNGVDQIVELEIGLDGIVFAQPQSGPELGLTQKFIYEAVAAKPYGQAQSATSWSDIDPSLPNVPIKIYGPPASSGTRDTLKTLFLEIGCRSDASVVEMEATDPDKYEATCGELRNDGVYVESGEDDELIVRNLESEPNSLGVFGYSFLEENTELLRGIPIFNITPNEETIGTKQYPGARSLYLYVKRAHVGNVPGLLEYLQAFVEGGGKDGYL